MAGTEVAVVEGERVYGGLGAAERAARRREQLLAAGRERFAADGWSGATVAGICRTAGLSQRYLYDHVGDREALFLAVVDRIADEVETVVREAAATPGTGPVERAQLVLAAVVGYFADDPRTVRVALVESLATARFRARRRELLARFSELAERLMRALRADADAPPSPAASVTATLLTGGLVELLIGGATDDPRVAPDDLVAHVAALATAAARLDAAPPPGDRPRQPGPEDARG